MTPEEMAPVALESMKCRMSEHVLSSAPLEYSVVPIRRYPAGVSARCLWSDKHPNAAKRQHYLCLTLEITTETEGDRARLADLLWVYLRPRFRGQGIGYALYRIAERVAADCGCSEIRATPSGWTPSDETRASYMQRRLEWLPLNGSGQLHLPLRNQEHAARTKA